MSGCDPRRVARALAARPAVGVGVLATGVICPCHALVGLAGLVLGGVPLSAAAQDGLHAAYVPLAVLIGAGLLRSARPATSSAQDERA